MSCLCCFIFMIETLHWETRQCLVSAYLFTVLWSLSVAETIWFWLGRDAINRVCTYLFMVVERSRNDMVLAGQRRD